MNRSIPEVHIKDGDKILCTQQRCRFFDVWDEISRATCAECLRTASHRSQAKAITQLLLPCQYCGQVPIITGGPDYWSVVCDNYTCSRRKSPRHQVLHPANSQFTAAKLWNAHYVAWIAATLLVENSSIWKYAKNLERENEKKRKKLLKLQFLLDKPRTYRLKLPRETESCSSRVWRLSKMGHSLTPGVLETTDIKRAMRHHLKSEYATYLQGLLL